MESAYFLRLIFVAFLINLSLIYRNRHIRHEQTSCLLERGGKKLVMDGESFFRDPLRFSECNTDPMMSGSNCQLSSSTWSIV